MRSGASVSQSECALWRYLGGGLDGPGSPGLLAVCVDLSCGCTDADLARQVVKAGEEAAKDGRRTRPDFMILGASKCGTTSLVRYLTALPCIGVSRKFRTPALAHRY